ncbi:MAG: isoprenyl transferase [Calditrichaeota bacterium]|nr:isoprenyl transferase [Calditrichota bacterium]RQV92606.1 MAG: isoprenyl transferase [bacterium]RQV99775.1 MAG: isoprenyl transferase [Calditrichota bacterium]
MNKKVSALEKLKFNGAKLPHHVAIIMDGNGRWAKKRGLPRVAGHNEGIKSVRAVVEAASDLEIKVLTLYTFSKENWYRPKAEVSALMRLLVSTIRKEIEELTEKNVQLKAIGNIEELPEQAYRELLSGIEQTKHNTGLVLNLALSYSGRQEVIDAVREIAQKVKAGILQPEEIGEQVFSAHLHTYDLPDPDLLIRTSGESRISNFLLWQIAYAEIYVTQTLWPDFRKDEFHNAILNYLSRERRFGRVSEQIVQNATG